MLFDDILYMLSQFFKQGGVVLYYIALVALLLWVLLIHKFIYFYGHFTKDKAHIIEQYNAIRGEQRYQSWYQQMYIARLQIKLFKFVPIIQVLVAICPVLGLLGTVMGMMEVFDLVILGMGNIKALSDGISKATIPTMAGMIVALSGFFFMASL